MITEYPLEPWRYDGSEYEPFWAAAAHSIDPPLSLQRRRDGRAPRRARPGRANERDEV
jgi:hypothetical protein